MRREDYESSAYIIEGAASVAVCSRHTAKDIVDWWWEKWRKKVLVWPTTPRDLLHEFDEELSHSQIRRLSNTKAYERARWLFGCPLCDEEAGQLDE